MKTIKKLSIFLLLFSGILLTSCELFSGQEDSSTEEVSEVQITFHVDSDTTSTVEKTFTKGTSLTSNLIQTEVFGNTTPVRVGYENTNEWYKDSAYTSKVTLPYTLDIQETLYLKWNAISSDEEEVQNITITYSVDGQVFDTKTIVKGTSAPSVATPIKDGYTFDTWCTDVNLTTPFVSTSRLQANQTLYARFKIKTYTVTYYDGSNQLQTVSVNHGTSLTPYTPTKSGYDFDGWYTNPGLTTPYESAAVTGTLDLYAKFNVQQINITFYVGSDATPSIVKSYPANTILTSDIIYTDVFGGTNPVKTGFVNTNQWWEDSTCTTTQVVLPYEVTTEKTIYLKWETIPAGANYTVTYYIDGNIHVTQAVESVFTLLTAPSKTGYTIDGWYIDKACSERYIQASLTSNLTLYAKYKLNTYQVQYFDPANTTTPLNTIEINHGETLGAYTPSKTGYTFGGWYTDASCNTAYQTSAVTGALELYAKFTLNTYQVQYYNPTNTTEPLKTVTVNHGDTLTEYEPDIYGYTFNGWYTNTACNTAYPGGEVTGALKLYAKLTPKSYTVTFYDSDNTTELSSPSVLYGTLVTKPSDPTAPENYTFDGWYTDTDHTLPYDFSKPLEGDLNLYAKYVESSIVIVSSQGYIEGAYVEFGKVNGVTNLSDYAVSYKSSSSSSYTTIDQELIREGDTSIRADILGLTAGTYSIRINIASKSVEKTVEGIVVTADDRSGYAHFNYTSGIGAYNNDGTLKSNAVVVYVTDATKNTVTATIGGKTYTGLVKIIQACTKSSYALDVRLIGSIKTAQWNPLSHGVGNTAARQTALENLFGYTTDSSGWDESSSTSNSKLNEAEIISKGINSKSIDFAKGITNLDGLTNQVLRSKTADKTTGAYEYDSYYNMLDVNGGYNITIEGVGTDAEIYQWGFNFKKCNSIEVKNIHFDRYTEDAVGFEGDSKSISESGNYWLHNCTFDIGVNNWDVCYEADKGDGDGSTDFKYCHNVTISYTEYIKTHKTNLIGSSDAALQYNFTIHHNYYNECGSRLPLLRQANVHFYNNYYYKTTSYCSSIRANAYGFFENNYYEEAQNPYQVVNSDAGAGAIKAFNNDFVDCTTTGSAYSKVNTVSSRTEQVTSTCKPDGSTSYANFDTNATLFYYDATNNKSDVSYLTTAVQAKTDCLNNAGVLKGTFTGSTGENQGGNTGDTGETPVTPANWQTSESNDFSSGIVSTIQSNIAPTAAGIYSYTNATTSTSNYLEVTNNSLLIADTSASTTYGYYIFNQKHESGKVRISIDFIPQTKNTKWTPIQFLTGETNLGIRTDESTYLSYTTGGTSLPNILKEQLVTGQTYKIVLTLDFTTNTATISINDTEVTVSGFAPTEITGIMFQTAGNASRSFTVDNLLVQTA